MSEQTIQSRDINVATVFQDFYVVPDYQREYVWTDVEVEQLLGDINYELGSSEPGVAPEYFIGSIVVCPGQAGTLDLIDGQQRMTTLFLILCAIRARLELLGQSIPGPLTSQISAVSTDAAGVDHFRYRLDLQYQDSREVLVAIAEGTAEQHNGDTRSTENIRNAYDLALAFLTKELGDDPTCIRGYYGYLTNKVKLIRIQTESVAKALKIFETINDRGRGLDAMDLLKNLLFMKADAEEFARLKTAWKEMQDIVYDMGEKPLRFLRYFIFSRYDHVFLREDEIYSWFSKNEAAVGYAKNPVAFARELLEAAAAYRNLLNGKYIDGTANAYLANLRSLGGRAARQHLILLLAARHLPPASFERVARELEQLFFVYIITRQPTRDFERDFARWAPELRSVRTEEDLSSFIERQFAAAKARLATRFSEAMRRVSALDVQAFRLRYILGKLAQHLEIAAHGESEGTKLSRFIDNTFEIEHIFPQTAPEVTRLEFGSVSSPIVVHRLGNLMLVEKSINASLGNRPFSQKRPAYAASQLLLTRVMGKHPKVGVDTRIDRAVAGLETFETWNEEAVDRRQAELARLALDVWNV